VRWDRYELIFAGRDKQSVTDLKDALWSHLNSDMRPMEMMSPYQRPYYRGGASYSMSVNVDSEAGAPWYEGSLPAHFRTSKPLRQWRPELNRVFSFAPPPVPMLQNWSAIEGASPDLNNIRAKLVANKSFDVCLISGSNRAGQSADGVRTNAAEVSIESRVQVLQSVVDGEVGGILEPPHQVKFDSASTRILSDSILAKLCLCDSMMGLRSIVSQISPTGGGNFEDVQVMDLNESALAIVTRVGDDIVVYRRIFHAN